MTVYLPIAGIEFNVLLLVGIGFCVGVLGGFFGVGGAWIVTPALNIFGFNMAFAIGTDLAHIFGKSVVATKKHARMGNVDWKLGLISVIGSVAGVEGGAQVVMLLERIGRVESVVRWAYMGLLFFLGGYMLYDYFSFIRAERRPRPAASSGAAFAGERKGLVHRLRLWRVPPLVSLPTSGIEQISVWVILLVFAVAGFLSGFLGVGGGFVLLPALIYLIGCPTAVAVGTSLLSVCFTGGYGCFTYSLKGRTELLAAMLMLLGAAVGAQIGVTAVRFVRGYGIRLLFAVMILLAGLSVALKQAEWMFGLPILRTLAGYLVMGAAGAMSLLIACRLFQGARAERAAS